MLSETKRLKRNLRLALVFRRLKFSEATHFAHI